MALFKIFKGTSANLPTTMVDGYCYFTMDDGQFYIDYLEDPNNPNSLRRRPISGPGFSVEYIEGTQTASTNAWTGITKDPALYTGKTIVYKLPYAGTSSNATLTLTFTNPTGTLNSGAIPVYYTGSTRATSQYGAGSVILLTYDGAGWRRADYNSNTTYSAMSVAEMRTGTATSSRTLRADYLKTFLSTLGGTGLSLTHTADGIVLDHTNSVTEKTSYGSTSTTASADGGSFIVTDITYDTEGHVTGSQDRTITLSQNIYTLPLAANGTRGGIQIGYATSGQNYAVQLSNEKAYVNVPWTDRYVNGASFTHDSTNNNIKMTLTRAGSDTVSIVGNIPLVSKDSAGVVPKGVAVSSQNQSTKFLREDGTWAAPSYTTYTSIAAASGGTAVSLVTTGEKYIWNNKQNALVFDGVYDASNNKAATVSTVTNAITEVTIEIERYI